MHDRTADGQGPVVSRRDAARRCGMSAYRFGRFVHLLDMVPQYGVNAAGEQFERETYTLASVDALRERLAAEKMAA